MSLLTSASFILSVFNPNNVSHVIYGTISCFTTSYRDKSVFVYFTTSEINRLNISANTEYSDPN